MIGLISVILFLNSISQCTNNLSHVIKKFHYSIIHNLQRWFFNYWGFLWEVDIVKVRKATPLQFKVLLSETGHPFSDISTDK